MHQVLNDCFLFLEKKQLDWTEICKVKSQEAYFNIMWNT